MLVRSINTTIIGVLPVAALLFAGAFILGEGPLKDLALALFVGMISGAYSSIFIATPLLAQLKEREPEMQKLAARVAARRAKEAQKTARIRSAPSRRAPRSARRPRGESPDQVARPCRSPTATQARAGVDRSDGAAVSGIDANGNDSGPRLRPSQPTPNWRPQPQRPHRDEDQPGDRRRSARPAAAQ